MKRVLVLIGLIVFSGSGFAQSKAKLSGKNDSAKTSLKLKSETKRTNLSRGIRVAFVRSNLRMKVEASMGRAAMSLQDTGHFTGISGGYVYLPVNQPGFIAALSIFEINMDDASKQLAKLEGNAAYAFTPTVYGKAGLNISRFTRGDEDQKLKPRLGYQFGLGLRVTPNVGFEANFVRMAQKGEINGINARVWEVGPELALTGTF